MKPSTNETQEGKTPTIKKSKVEKAVELFRTLNLDEMDKTIAFLTEIYDTELGKEAEKLNAQVADLQNKQAKLNK